MNVSIFLGLCLTMALTIWGKTLRERAFRELPPDQRGGVVDKVPNYSAAEMIPLGGLTVGLVGLVLFRPQWLRAGFAVYTVLTVTLVVVFHFRTRGRFRLLGLPVTFRSAYESSRRVTYSALAVLLALFAWVVNRYF